MWFLYVLGLVSVLFFSLLLVGVWRGRMYFGPANHPIIFSQRPFAFVCLGLLYLAAGSLFALVPLLLTEYSVPRHSHALQPTAGAVGVPLALRPCSRPGGG